MHKMRIINNPSSLQTTFEEHEFYKMACKDGLQIHHTFKLRKVICSISYQKYTVVILYTTYLVSMHVKH